MKEINSLPDGATNTPSTFADFNWKLAALYTVISAVVGGTTVGGVTLTKSNPPAGISQAEADVRYLSKEEADKRRDRLEKMLAEQLKEIKDEQKDQGKKLDSILEKVYSGK